MLAVDQLSYRHQQSEAGFGPLSFALAEGEAALLLGPSGSGKSTLMHCIAGMLSPQQGDVLVAGQSMAKRDAAGRDTLRRETMGLVLQALRLVSALSVEANLALAAKLAGRAPDQRAARELLERLGIAHRAHALPRQLSQGEAQRAAIARALITRPRLLMADEPTSALDDGHATSVAQLLADLARDAGAALLIVTHDHRLQALFPRAIRLGTDGLIDTGAATHGMAGA